MKKQKKLHTHWCLLGGIVLASVYWLSEAILHSTIFHGEDLSTELLPLDNLGELWMRLFILTLFIIFGIVMDITLANLRRANQKSVHLVDQLKKSLAEVKTLSGLLPICAVCKKVRDDRGYWHQVETYFHQHSDAEFTHGYCPGCAVKVLSTLDERVNIDERGT